MISDIKKVETVEKSYIVQRTFNEKERLIAAYLEENGCRVIGRHDRSMVWWRGEFSEKGVPIIEYEGVHRCYEDARKFFMKRDLMKKKSA